ncbi:MAG: DUF2017 family protein [Actinomycetota bacterium]|nr:DUF2017 family protein [Actinomycetota bacterium]
MTTLERDDDGHLVATLHAYEVQAITVVATDVRDLLREPPAANPVSARLFPNAYSDPTEDAAEREWQEMVHPDLAGKKIAGLDEIVTLLGRGRTAGDLVRVVLDAEQEELLLGTVNDLRLALGAALGITADTDFDDLEEGPGALYEWLGMFEERLVQLLLDDFPDMPPDDDGE